MNGKLRALALGLGSLLLIWQIGAMAIPTYMQWLAPAPLEVGRYLVKNAREFAVALAETALSSSIGLLVGATIGFLLAIAFHLMPPIERAIYPIVSSLPAIPVVAIAPLIVLWFGYELKAKVFIVTFICFFPILVTVLTGLREGYAAQREYLRMQGAPMKATLRYMDLPASLGYFAAGLKTAAPIAVVGAIVAEYVAPKRGLGYLVISYALRTDITGVIAAALTSMLLGLAFAGITSAGAEVMRRRISGD
jgi:NitT/TauT family transport system permease protein